MVLPIHARRPRHTSSCFHDLIPGSVEGYGSCGRDASMKLPSGVRWVIWAWCGLACGVFFISSGMAQNAAQPNRQVAITIDDLPAGSAGGMSAATITEMTSKLMAALREQKVPAVGFGHEEKVYKNWGGGARIKEVAVWGEAGVEIGEQHYRHFLLNKGGVRKWGEDV